MKKFVLMCIAVMLIILGVYRSVYYDGWLYIPDNSPVSAVAVVDQEEMYLVNESGEKTAIQIKGVDVPSFSPGRSNTGYVTDPATWIRWFDYIQKMGANTILIHNIYNVEFYDAFYKYNVNREKPLYLLQGIRVAEYDNNSAKDAYGEGFYQQLLRDGRSAIDVVHGKKNTSKQKGIYRSDVSKWVIGYMVGESWGSDVIAYTNANEEYSTVYKGKYFSTVEGSNVFEAMLAKIMDEMVSYETSKYASQRLISFVNAPQSDPFEYDSYYGKQIGKFNCLDAERIKVNNEAYQGYYASYQLYEYCPGFEEYFSTEQKEKLGATLSQLNKKYYYEGYTELLSKYHTVPVVISDYGFSTSRGTDGVDGGYTEVQQGKMIVDTYQDIVDSGCAGAFVSSWFDTWNRIAWNTSYSVNLADIGTWHDVQAIGQNYGIMAFEPGKSESCCYVDGKIEEWSSDTPVVETEKYSLYVKYDQAYMYFMVKGEEITKRTGLYIPIDTLDSVGSRMYQPYNLTFSKSADFVLCINGINNTKLLVQERYNSLRENYLEEITGENPFSEYPKKDSKTFVPIQMILSKFNMVTPEMEELGQVEKVYSKTYDTGKLVYGNANPNSEMYDSLADFCFGNNCVEVRIPWNLLNVSSPYSMLIHDDYYQYYGREDKEIEEIYLGIADRQENRVVKMEKMPVSGWDSDEIYYHERLKQSYYIIQEEWRE